MKKSAQGGYRGMCFEHLEAAAVGDYYTTKLYGIEGVPGVYRRVSSKTEGAIPVWFDGGLIFLVEWTAAMQELAEAGMVAKPLEMGAAPMGPVRAEPIQPQPSLLDVLDQSQTRSEPVVTPIGVVDPSGVILPLPQPNPIAIQPVPMPLPVLDQEPEPHTSTPAIAQNGTEEASAAPGPGTNLFGQQQAPQGQKRRGKAKEQPTSHLDERL